MNLMHNLKINFHGESWTLKKFECTADEYEKCVEVAAKMNLNLTSSCWRQALRLTQARWRHFRSVV